MLVSKWNLIKKAFDLEDLDAPDDPDYLYNLDKLNDLCDQDDLMTESFADA